MKNFSWLIVLVALGSISRLVFALEFQLWNQSPDQLAWELNLQEIFENGNWSYDSLIHYPHEGGTILISLFSLLFKPFTPFYSLVISVFVLDFAFRLIQLEIVKRIAGIKAMIIYGIWSICAIPILISWGGINYGLHAISATFPFVFVYLLFREHNTTKSYFQDGLFLGLSGWFIYSNFLFVPIYFLFLLYKKNKLNNYVVSASALMLVFSVHLLIRNSFDAGFHLSSFEATSIRGQEFEIFNLDSYKALLTIWTGAVRESSLLIGNFIISTNTIRWLWFCLSIAGIGTLIYAVAKKERSVIYIFGILVVIVYVSAYSISPFSIIDSSRANYVFSRHLAYIFPFLMALSLIGFLSFKKMSYVIILLVLISFSGFVSQLKSPKSDAILYRPAGWVLTTKFGHNPERLSQIVISSQLDGMAKNELTIGYGWGLGTAFFQGIILDSNSKDEVEARTNQLIELFDQFPKSQLHEIKEGVVYSFSDQVEPLLHKSILIEHLAPKMDSIIGARKYSTFL